MKKEANFLKIAGEFDISINAIRVLNGTIGRLAEDHDRSVTNQINLAAAQMVGISLDDLNSLERISLKDFQSALDQQTNNGEHTGSQMGALISTEQQAVFDKIAASINLDPTNAFLKTATLLQSSFQNMPVQTFLLRRSALIALASYFEFLIAQLLHAFYSLFPKALPGEKNLTLDDLRRFTTIEDVENFLVDREIDALLRESVNTQLEHFSKKRQVKLDPLEVYRNDLIEIHQRRNIIVHNNGIVNRIYLEQVPKGVLGKGVKEGDQVDVSKDYLERAIDLVQICGVMLIQLCWRHWQKGGLKLADSIYTNFLAGSLRERRFTLVTSLQDFSHGLAFGSEQVKRSVIVNHAIALRELNQKNEMESLIGTLDWSASAPEFKIALYALRKDTASLIKALPSAIAAKSIQKYHLETWPLFDPFREMAEFSQLVENCPNEIVIPTELT